MAYAHSKNEAGKRHDLVEHLTCVAEQARAFADKFGAGDLAYWAGLWHDLGKFNPKFQAYLMAQEEGRSHPRVPHAIWGAALAYWIIWTQHREREAWKELALPIAGHHTGLAKGGTMGQSLEAFLAEQSGTLAAIARHLQALPRPPQLPALSAEPTRRELRLRMVFSALVDADYLNTERHFNPDRATQRRQSPTPGVLLDQLLEKQLALPEQARQTAHSRVIEVRQEVYESCLQAATGPQGVYRLTVPTGGGKTRSSLAFALRHAQDHNLDRVIVAIPYTSIIDQTAKVYREILGTEAVVEHHSQFSPPANERIDQRMLRLRLGTENWDAAVIVTTTVQLFESLLGRRPSATRKLHNIARSVIILDEVQTLPTALLEPTLDVLRALVEEYGVTVVLSTATQPALEATHYLKAFQGLPVTEIVPDYPQHFQLLRRVSYEWWPESVSWSDLTEHIAAEPQIMVILNTRRDALALLVTLKARGVADVYHLSTLLCGAHRRQVLAEVTARLQPGSERHVRLISTQVVEAGVDLDFPTVWRAVGPLDRIVQAAGRCNRGGKQTIGRVVIFQPAEGRTPQGPYAAAIIEARALLERYSADRLHDPDLFREFFTRLFAVVPVDQPGIQTLRAALDYPAVAKHYRLIDQETVSVVVGYSSGARRLAAWQRTPSRVAWQRLQPYTVGIYRWEAEQHVGGLLEPIGDTEDLYRWTGNYDERIGLAAVLSDPSDLVPFRKEA